MDSNNPNPDPSSEDALKDLTAELENFTADDTANATEGAASDTPADAPAADAPVAPAEEAPAADTPADTPADAPVDAPADPTPEAPAARSIEVTSEPDDAPYAPDPIDSPTPDPSLTDFTKVSADLAKEEEEEDSEKEKDTTPLKPAAPVPGSIGSAKSYDPEEAAKPPKKKLSTTAILAIALIGILVIAVVVVVFLLISQSSSSSSNGSSSTSSTGGTTQPATVQTSYATLTCTTEGDDDTLEAELYSGLESSSERIIANYENDELVDITSTFNATFDTNENATYATTTAQENYVSQLEVLGLDGDPFSSSYDRSGNTITVTHMALASEIDATNAELFSIPVSGSKASTALNTLSSTYTARGASCVEK